MADRKRGSRRTKPAQSMFGRLMGAVVPQTESKPKQSDEDKKAREADAAFEKEGWPMMGRLEEMSKNPFDHSREEAVELLDQLIGLDEKRVAAGGSEVTGEMGMQAIKDDMLAAWDSRIEKGPEDAPKKKPAKSNGNGGTRTRTNRGTRKLPQLKNLR